MSNAKVAKLQSSWYQRFKVKAKIKSPSGIVLSTKETEALVDIQKQDVAVLKGNQQEVLAAMRATYLNNIGSAIKKASGARGSAAAIYKKTIDPIKKREWAKRVVVADETRASLLETKKRMESTRERLEMMKGDLELQIIEAEVRVAETEAYVRAGKQLKLAGQTLVDARNRAKGNIVEYTSLEVDMEETERIIDKRSDVDLIARADEILGTTK